MEAAENIVFYIFKFVEQFSLTLVRVLLLCDNNIVVINSRKTFCLFEITTSTQSVALFVRRETVLQTL